jgi:DNA polymerase III delta prime subunit
MKLEMFKRVSAILKAENIEFDKQVVAKIVSDFFPDFRRTINELQRYSTFGKIDADVLKHFAVVRDLDALIKNIREKDFGVMR